MLLAFCKQCLLNINPECVYRECFVIELRENQKVSSNPSASFYRAL